MNMKRPASGPVSPDPTAHNDSMRRLQIGIAGVMAVLVIFDKVRLCPRMGKLVTAVVLPLALCAAPLAFAGEEAGSADRTRLDAQSTFNLRVDNDLFGGLNQDQGYSNGFLASWVSPNPGGVGPMTIACLLANTLTATLRVNGLPEPEGLTP